MVHDMPSRLVAFRYMLSIVTLSYTDNTVRITTSCIMMCRFTKYKSGLYCRCEVGGNTQLMGTSTTEMRFSFEDMEFTTNHEGIDVFCDAVFCNVNDYSSRCTSDCNAVK